MQDLVKKLKGASWRLWLILLLLSLAISILALRHNNLEMVKLRNDVYAADKADKGIEQALTKLRAYVYSHMNTNLSAPNGVYPPIQLEYTYNRLKQKAVSNVYHDAQVYCEKNQPSGYYGAYRINCVQNYIEKHPLKSSDLPPALYQFDFASPAWSPDLAGWSLVASSLFLAIFMFSFIGSYSKPH